MAGTGNVAATERDTDPCLPGIYSLVEGMQTTRKINKYDIWYISKGSILWL